jgi:hypothetical protein
MTADDLKDQYWRLSNLYSCRIEGIGKPVKFRPRPEQEVLIKHLIEQPTVPAYVIKSRRLGISTAVDTFQTDCAAFTQGFRGIIIDQKQDDATKKMVEIVRFAFDSLDPLILQGFRADKRNDSELRIRHAGEEESQDSVIFATTGGRGGDCSMLHVSEWGPIAATDPNRSNEIRTGAFPAARKGRRVVETTWYGGKGGDLWELIKPIMESDPNAEGILYFFPWHSDPQAIKLDGKSTPEIEHYFKELAGKLGKSFSQEQKQWYAAKKIEQGIFVKREYPSTLEEAFSAPVEGSIYGDAIMEARGAGRIIPFEWNRSNPVFSFWDLGWDDSTSIWLLQLIGHDLHWIWHAEERHHNAAEMVQIMDATGIPVSGHYIPHDGGHKKPGEGKSYKDRLEEAGLVNVTVVPQCRSKWPGIDALRSMLSRSYFRLPFTEKGIAALEAYHTKTVSSGGTIAKDPVHDWSSHTCDAARTAAEAIELGLVKTSQAKRLMNAPRTPDGAIVDLVAVREIRERSRSHRQTATFGGIKL